MTFTCQCGRVNELMITPEILEPDRSDSMELAAWKQRQRRKLERADEWYKENEHGANSRID